MDYVDEFGRPVFGLTARCAIVKDGKLLLIREKAESSWETPGGSVEVGEKPEQTAKRETLEETGYEVKIGRLLSVSVGDYPKSRNVSDHQKIRHDSLKRLCIMFEAKLGKKISEPESAITGMKWFTPEELKKLVPDWHDREAFAFALERMKT